MESSKSSGWAVLLLAITGWILWTVALFVLLDTGIVLEPVNEVTTLQVIDLKPGSEENLYLIIVNDNEFISVSSSWELKIKNMENFNNPPKDSKEENK